MNNQQQVQAQAIYRVVPLAQAYRQDTLIYNLKDGFAWVSTRDSNSPWFTKNSTAIGAELEARQAGLNPTAVAYIPRS